MEKNIDVPLQQVGIVEHNGGIRIEDDFLWIIKSFKSSSREQTAEFLWAPIFSTINKLQTQSINNLPAKIFNKCYNN